jgi:phage terminase small subunit
MADRYDKTYLTDKQKKFVEFVGGGLTQTAAARQAGFKFASVDGYKLMRTPKIIKALEKERTKYEHASMMTRKKVIDGLLEAVDIARTVSEPSSMVAGWREVARICGYFAPETKQINISVSGAVRVAQIEQMTDEELSKLILEGEAVRVDDDNLDDDAQALLEYETEIPNAPDSPAPDDEDA